MALRNAPRALRDFFIDSPPPDPPWLDHDAFTPGFRAFHDNAVAIFYAFVAGVLIDGFSTLISKSFVQTGRVFDEGVRRLKQNNRHQVEIFFPGGLRRQGDGWKLSVRIRFVHAQVRHLLRHTKDWDADAWGTPVSAAHLGYALACFSARTLKHSISIGAAYTAEQRRSFCDVWRYAGHLMGIPETILYTDEEDALHLYRIGSVCEPPPTEDAVLMAPEMLHATFLGICCGRDYVAERRRLCTRQENRPILRNIISCVHIAFRKAIRPLFSFHGRSGSGSVASHSAIALAFISRSISA